MQEKSSAVLREILNSYFDRLWHTSVQPELEQKLQAGLFSEKWQREEKLFNEFIRSNEYTKAASSNKYAPGLVADGHGSIKLDMDVIKHQLAPAVKQMLLDVIANSPLMKDPRPAAFFLNTPTQEMTGELYLQMMNQITPVQLHDLFDMVSHMVMNAANKSQIASRGGKGEEHRLITFSQGLYMDKVYAEVRSVLQDLSLSDPLVQLRNTYRNSSKVFVEEVVDQSKLALRSLAQFLGGQALISGGNDVVAAYETAAERLGLYYANLLTKLTELVENRLRVVDFEGNVKPSSITVAQIREAIKSRLQGFLSNQVLSFFHLAPDQVVFAVASSTTVLTLMLGFIVLGMSAIQGTSAVSAVINSGTVVLAGLGKSAGGKGGDADGQNIAAMSSKIFDFLERTLKDVKIEDGLIDRALDRAVQEVCTELRELEQGLS